MRNVSAVLASCVALIIGSTASADTFLVDDDGGPGVDYLDIPPAVAAADAGDVILVNAGDYSPFVLEEGVRILGQPGVRVELQSEVRDVPANQLAALVELELQELRVQDCDGTVVLADVHWADGAQSPPTLVPRQLRVSGCRDVRLFGCTQDPSWTGFSSEGVGVFGCTHVEVTQSELRGRAGRDTDTVESAGDGGDGLETSQSRVLVSSSNVRGGRGGDFDDNTSQGCNLGATPGDGGDALRSVGSSELIACGRSMHLALGGAGGVEPSGTSTCMDGIAGHGLLVGYNAAARVSGITVDDGGYVDPIKVFPGGVLVQPDPPDPTLTFIGTPHPGELVRFHVYGPPGADARLVLGRQPRVEATPDAVIEILCTRDRIFELGTIPASGALVRAIQIPSYLPAGFAFFGQAETTLAGGELARTNSIPVIVR